MVPGPSFANELPLATAKLPMSDSSFNFLRTLALNTAGIALADHKRSMVYRRLSRRVVSHGYESFDAYCRLLSSPGGQSEVQHAINALTTNKTSFFRESHHFDHLSQSALPDILGTKHSPRRSHRPAERLRIWSAGCSSGQEAYSIAITLVQSSPEIGQIDARILATDIDTDVLATARAGSYASSELEALSAHQQKTYFEPVAGQASQMRIRQSVQALIAFRTLNLHADWPMKRGFDVIFCRNVAIYFDKETQCRLIDRFADALLPNGLLYVGHSESLFRISERFRPIGQSIYRKIA
jgi:chemotaxis protein methyltransferase CheR